MENGIALTFAGQAGFLLQTDSGYRVGIDLYLSDCCNRYFGFKRLMPYIFDPMNLNLDLLVATHAHYDHFDPESIPIVMADQNTKVLCAKDCYNEAVRLNLDQSRITYIAQGEVFENSDVKIVAMPCDHGAETPDAIGLLIEAGGKRIYVAGDTCFREDYFSAPELKNVDVMIMPINGAFGNLNETQGAKAAAIVDPKLCIPCHYWNFAEHLGNPRLFIEAMKDTCPDVSYLLMRPGERIKL